MNKENRIDEWNQIPEIKQSNIEAIDKNKFMKIGKVKKQILSLLSVLGIIALIVLIGSAGIYGYTLYNDGTLLNKPIEIICGNTSCEAQIVNIDKGICPPCPENHCPNCSNICNFPTELEIKLVNGTT